MGTRLYVGNLPFSMDEAQLRALFAEGGRQVGGREDRHGASLPKLVLGLLLTGTASLIVTWVLADLLLDPELSSWVCSAAGACCWRGVGDSRTETPWAGWCS